MADTHWTDPVPAATPPEPTPSLDPTPQPRWRMWPEERCDENASPTIEYTRRATAGKGGDGVDLIRAKPLVDFWKIMTVLGGIAILWTIISLSYYAGKQQATVTPALQQTPITTTVPAPAPPATATQPPASPATVTPPTGVTPNQPAVAPPQPASSPTKIQVDANINLKVDRKKPAQETNQKQPVLSEAEQRNEALKERLRRQHGIIK